MDKIEQDLIIAELDHLTYKFRRLIEIYGEGNANIILVEAYQTAQKQSEQRSDVLC